MPSVPPASLRDVKPNGGNSSVSELQCRGRRSEDLYLSARRISAAHQVRMRKLRSTHCRGTRADRPNESVSKLQRGSYRSEHFYVTSLTTNARRDKVSEQKALRDDCHFDQPLCGDAGQNQETKKMDRRFHRCAELGDSSVSCLRWRPVFRGHLDRKSVV